MRKPNDSSGPKLPRFGRNRGEVRLPTSEAPDQLAFPQAAVSPDEAARIAASIAPSTPAPRRFGRTEKAPGATPATPGTAAFPESARTPSGTYEEQGTPVAPNQLAFPQAALPPEEARKIAADLQPRPQDKVEQVWVEPARDRARNRILMLTVAAGLIVVVVFFFSPLNPRQWTPETPAETASRHAREATAQIAPVTNRPPAAGGTAGQAGKLASSLPVAAQIDLLMKEAENQQLTPEGYNDAIESYRRALLLLDKNSAADTPLRRITHFRIAVLLNNSNRFLEAADEYRVAAALGAPDADLQNSLGVALFNSGQSDQIAPAAQAFREAVRINPNLAAAWTNLAAIQERTGDITGATKSRKNAERLTGATTPTGSPSFMSPGTALPGVTSPQPEGINGVTGLPNSSSIAP